MQTKTCESCGKDYPSETNRFCPECFNTLTEEAQYYKEVKNDTNKMEAIKKIDAIIMHIKETQDFYEPLTSKLETLKDFINKNL